MSTGITAVSVRFPEQLKAKIEARTARIGVVGLGYVGFPLVLLRNTFGYAYSQLWVHLDRGKVAQEGCSN